MRHLLKPILGIVLAVVVAGSASATSLTLAWGSLSSSIHAGAYATATVKATHGARCGIVVQLATTVSKASGLISKTVPSSGVVSWRWKVGTSTHTGVWRVTVTCKLGATTKSIWRTISVTAAGFSRVYRPGQSSLTTFAAGRYRVSWVAGGCISWQASVAPTNGGHEIALPVTDGSGSATVTIPAGPAHVNSSASCPGSSAWRLTLERL